MFWEKYGIEKSILIGAVLISLSICWSAGKISWPGNEPIETKPAETKTAERKDAPKIGNGKVEIVEFADFQCFFCQKFFSEAYKEIKSKYIDTGKITLTFRHFPIPSHQNAQKAAEAAECAGKQGKFGAYHDVLFANGKPDGAGLAV